MTFLFFFFLKKKFFFFFYDFKIKKKKNKHLGYKTIYRGGKKNDKKKKDGSQDGRKLYQVSFETRYNGRFKIRRYDVRHDIF